MNHYDIAVQRAPLPWMSKFKAIHHYWDEPHGLRLTIVTTRGDQVSFARMDKRNVTVAANHRVYLEGKRAQEAQIREAVRQERETLPPPPLEEFEVPSLAESAAVTA